jgi:hypothetical protein
LDQFQKDIAFIQLHLRFLYYEIDCTAMVRCIKVQILRIIQKVSLCQQHNEIHYSQLPENVRTNISSPEVIKSLMVVMDIDK